MVSIQNSVRHTWKTANQGRNWKPHSNRNKQCKAKETWGPATLRNTTKLWFVRHEPNSCEQPDQAKSSMLPSTPIMLRSEPNRDTVTGKLEGPKLQAEQMCSRYSRHLLHSNFVCSASLWFVQMSSKTNKNSSQATTQTWWHDGKIKCNDSNCNICVVSNLLQLSPRPARGKVGRTKDQGIYNVLNGQHELI